MEAAESETLEETIKFAHEVLASWQERQRSGLHAATHLLSSDAHIPLVYGLAAHTHELAVDVLDLVERGRVLSAYPLARLVYECALTSQWTALNRGAPQAIMNEMVRHQRVLSGNLDQAKSDILREGAGTLPYQDAEDLLSAANSGARNFQQMCADLVPAGIDAYVYYRLMSRESHASIHVSDYYVTEPADDHTSAALKRVPDQPDGQILAGFTAYSMVWAGSAFDYMLAGRPRRTTLEEFARRLGVPAMMRLEPGAGQRQFALEKDAKERERRERRSLARKDVT